MYFDFEDDRPDISPVGRAISWREGVLISVILHLLVVILLITAPDLQIFQSSRSREVAAAPFDDDRMRFVFVEPHADVLSPTPPPRPELSDENRVATAPEQAAEPANPMPLSRGDTSERVERAEQEPEAARGEPDSPEDGAGEQPAPPGQERALELAEALEAAPLPPPAPETQVADARLGPPRGVLGDALRNLDRYVQSSQYENPGGNASFGPFLQFDTRGVDFGRWVLRFKAQVERNWYPLIPQAAMLSFSGRVVLTLHVHKDGSITDLAVVAPSRVEGFNHAAYGALASSNPTVPLPSEYPAEKAFFTVTFFYNERPE
jgi:TonB family protein